jgi:hypothetical protein
MLTKLYICTEDIEYFQLLKCIFKGSKIIEIRKLSESEFSKCHNFDVILYYTSLMAPFGVKPTGYESIIIETHHRFNYPDFVVTSPNFEGLLNTLTEEGTHVKQIETPLRKVIEFSKSIRRDLSLAVHADINMPKDLVTVQLLLEIRNTIFKLLKEENVSP